MGEGRGTKHLVGGVVWATCSLSLSCRRATQTGTPPPPQAHIMTVCRRFDGLITSARRLWDDRRLDWPQRDVEGTHEVHLGDQCTRMEATRIPRLAIQIDAGCPGDASHQQMHRDISECNQDNGISPPSEISLRSQGFEKAWSVYHTC